MSKISNYSITSLRPNPRLNDPNILQLETLGIQYDNTMIEYQQALASYTDYLQTQTPSTLPALPTVKLYTGDNYTGSVYSIGVGVYNYGQGYPVPNDALHSLVVPEGLAITLWEGYVNDTTYKSLVLGPGSYPSLTNYNFSNITSSCVVNENLPNTSPYVILGIGTDGMDYVRDTINSPWVRLNNDTAGDLIAIASNPVNNSVVAVNKSNELLYKNKYTDYSWTLVKNYTTGVASCCIIDVAICPDGRTVLAVNTERETVGSVDVDGIWQSQTNPSQWESSIAIAVAPDNTVLTVGGNQIYSKPSCYTMTTEQWGAPYTNSCCVISITVTPDNKLIGVGTDNYLYTKTTYQNTGEVWSQVSGSNSMVSVTTVKVGNGLSGNNYTFLPLDGNTNTYCRGDGWNENGWPISPGFMTTDSCAQACDANPSCTAFDQSQLQPNGTYMCTMFNVQNVVPEENSTSFGCYTKNLNPYTQNLADLNTKLISLNNQITTLMEQSFPQYKEEVKERNQKKRKLEGEYAALIMERDKVNALIKDYESLGDVDENSQIVVTEYYSRYIGYLLISIILIILFCRVIISGSYGEQRGGGVSSKTMDLYLLFGIMILFIGLAIIFKETASSVILFILVVAFILSKMKIIPKLK